MQRSAACVSERELLERSRAGDEEAFCALAGLYARRVYLVARSFCSTAEDAEDLSQEVWLRAVRSLGEFRGDCAFYTWVRQIMLHTFLNAKRASARERHRVAVDESLVGGEGSAINRVLAQRAMLALQELPEQQRLIVILKHLEGMTYDEIARTLHCSEGTVKKALFRAIQKLRGHLNVEVVCKEKPDA